MFVGHLGVGLALKKLAPETNLGTLFFFSLLLDLLLGVFVLLGLEQVMVPENYAELHYLTFQFPYSHSLAAGALWSTAAFFGAIALFRKKGRSTLQGSFVIGMAVCLHWICDWVEHPAQIPVAGPQSRMLGLGLWKRLEIALALEMLLVIVGLSLYLHTARNVSRQRQWAIGGLLILLTTVAVGGQMTATEAPGGNELAISWIVQTVVLTGMAMWIERKKKRIS